MEITEERHGDVVVLRCTGRYKLGDGKELLRLVEDGLAAGESLLVLDLFDLGHLSSEGVGTTILACVKVRDEGSRIAVRVSNEVIAYWPATVGDLVFPFETLEEALEFLAD